MSAVLQYRVDKRVAFVTDSSKEIEFPIDEFRQAMSDLGFSIKSRLGSKSTLLNAGKTTNFVYRVLGFKPTEREMQEINQVNTKSKVKDRINAITNAGGMLQFIAPEQDIFKNNLVLIDSLLPNIVAEMIKCFFTSKLNSIEELTEYLTQENPISYDTQFAHTFYEYKIKRFLTDVALGMTPSKVWTGVYDATGGYLVVKENGDVLCYHIYNRNHFEDYLFANTALHTASTNKFGFGKIYEDKGHYYFKLNLQIRFK